jgi:recombination protein RecA
VAALVPKAEIEGDMGDSHVGLQARLMSQALRKVTGSVARSHCIIMFTNQIRMKIGVMFGSPETTTGGNALKFYASQRLDIRRIGAIKESIAAGKDPVAVGNRTRVKVVKNKLAAPFREVEFDILYGQGISRSGEIIDLASDLNIIQKSGAWFSVDGERIGQGRDNARTYLETHPELMARIEQKLLLHHGITGGGTAAPNVNAPGSAGVSVSSAPSAAGKPSGKGEAAGHAAPSDPGGSANNAKRGNVRPS